MRYIQSYVKAKKRRFHKSQMTGGCALISKRKKATTRFKNSYFTAKVKKIKF